MNFQNSIPTTNQMIHNAISQIRRRINHEPLSFKFLPALFTLTQLQHVFEAVMGEEIDKRNFRKRVKDIDFIEKTELIDKVNFETRRCPLPLQQESIRGRPIVQLEIE